MSAITSVASATAQQPAVQQHEIQESVAAQEERLLQRPDTITLQGKALAEEAEAMDGNDAQALLQRIQDEPQALLEAHNAISPARLARLLELTV
ncbi:hypothetical protein [Megalodesulfovibrio paquesii]